MVRQCLCCTAPVRWAGSAPGRVSALGADGVGAAVPWAPAVGARGFGPLSSHCTCATGSGLCLRPCGAARGLLVVSGGRGVPFVLAVWLRMLRRRVANARGRALGGLVHTLAFPAPVSFGTHEETPQLGRRKKRDTRGHPSSHCDPSPSWFIIIVIRRDGDVSPSASMSILVRCRSRFLLVPLLSLWLW